jgi:CRP/FNR family cyclic AMP-dependent transcriptional regulator
MARNAKTFDPKTFLATVNRGRTASTYPRDAVVFQQASPADAVFYIRKGRIKIVVASQQGKEAVVAVLGPDEFFGEGCFPIRDHLPFAGFHQPFGLPADLL